MKCQVKTRKKIPVSDFTKNCIATLLKRFIILILLCSLFVAAALYIPEKVTYEKIPKENSLNGYIPSQNNYTEHTKGSNNTVYTENKQLHNGSDVMILKLCEDNGSVCVFAEDGTKRGIVKFSGSAVTNTDLCLLRDGIVLTNDELYELLCQLEAEFCTGDTNIS